MFNETQRNKTFKIKVVLKITATLVLCGIFISYASRTAPADHIDNNTLNLLQNYLSDTDLCEKLMSDNTIEKTELEVLKNLNKHHVFKYSNLKSVESELNCLSESFSHLLYTGWAIDLLKKEAHPKVKARMIISDLLRTSVVLSSDYDGYIPLEDLVILGEVEYFKKPFRMKSSLLDAEGQD